jgi:hypothetical protein
MDVAVWLRSLGLEEYEAALGGRSLRSEPTSPTRYVTH